MEKVVVPLTTGRPIDQLLAWIERFALPALGLAGPGLMTPRPVKTENTAPRGGNNHGPFIGRLAGEDLTTGQASLIICFIVGTHGGVGPCARWARRPDIVRRLESTRQLRDLAACSCDTTRWHLAPSRLPWRIRTIPHATFVLRGR